jgi:hypothetical protein
MGSGFDDSVYWQFFTITLDYNNPHIELLLDNEFLTLIWIVKTPVSRILDVDVWISD